MVKALLGIMSPRRIPIVYDALRKIDYVDIAIAQNMIITDAHKALAKACLDGGYDVLIKTSDDLVIPYLAPYRLIQDYEMTGYKVITGWSFVRPWIKKANITFVPIRNIDRYVGRPVYMSMYPFPTIDEIRRKIMTDGYIVPVWFVGFSLTLITADVIEKWEPRGWYMARDRYGPWPVSTDLRFSYDIWKMGIQAYADLSVYCPHLAYGRRDLLIGREEPRLVIWDRKRDKPKGI